MAKLTLLLFGLLAVSQVFGLNSEDLSQDAIQTIQNELNEVADEVEKETKFVKTRFTGSVAAVRDNRQEALNRLSMLYDLFDKASSEIDSAPVQCRGDLKNKLSVLKSAKVGGFFTCSKLLEAGKDIGEVAVTTANIAVDVLDIGRDVVSGFSGCLSRWYFPWTIIECLYDRITTTYDDIKRTLADIKGYTVTIEEYAHNATVLLEECWNGSAVETQVLSVMQPLYKCSNKPVPNDFYKM